MGDIEPLSSHTVGDERRFLQGAMQAEGSDELHPFALRITQIYRREDGDWKIIHRHADPIMQQTEPAWFKQGQR